jgi:hypothetical protein
MKKKYDFSKLMVNVNSDPHIIIAGLNDESKLFLPLFVSIGNRLFQRQANPSRPKEIKKNRIIYMEYLIVLSINCSIKDQI